MKFEGVHISRHQTFFDFDKGFDRYGIIYLLPYFNLKERIRWCKIIAKYN